MDTPPEHLRNGAVDLRRWQPDDAELAWQLVRASLDHLRPWLPWATDGYSLADSADYLRRCADGWADGSQFQYLILDQGEPAGSAGLMARIGAGGLEIGYWVHVAHIGRGVATAASAALTEAGLALPGIDRVEIHHDVGNLASGRVPAKLGYTDTGTAPSSFEPAPADCGTVRIWRLTSQTGRAQTGG